MDFRKPIKAICNQKGITQKELAEKLEITAIGLNKALKGEYPQLQTLERIAKALDVHISALFEQGPGDTSSCPHCGGRIKLCKWQN